MKPEEIRVISVAVIKNIDGRIFAIPYYEHKKQEDFYRLPGGGVEFQETAEDALKRELKEEFDAEINIIRLIKVSENIFEFEGKKGHEICFIFEAEFIDKSLYQKEQTLMIDREEPGEYAEWANPNHPRIYPAGSV
jgi:ADP-ribose pyrophosphatase YjhB (NUDIX family)